MSIRKIIDAIVENKAVEANDMLKETMNNIVAEKLLEAKKIVATRFGIEDYAGLNEAKEATGDLKDTCWKGYTAVGLKTKDGKKVPNCVPVNEDEHSAARELKMYADNDSHLHKTSHVPVAKNLEKKFKKGTYDHEKAKTLWKYHADRAADSYAKEYGSGQKGHQMFSVADRKKAADMFASDHHAEMKVGNFHTEEVEVNEESLDEKAKWRSSSAVEPNPHHDEYEYDKQDPYRTSPIKSKADTEHPYGSLSTRPKPHIATKGPNVGKMTKKSVERLKSRIKTNLNMVPKAPMHHEEIEVNEESLRAIVTKKNSDGSYDEVGMRNRTLINGNRKGIIKKAREYARGPHRIEFHKTDSFYKKPHETLHQEDFEVTEEALDEANIQRMGRVKLIKARIRAGKVQRRKKLSAVKGFTLRGGKLVRMSAQEKMKRKRGARKAKIKRRAKAARIRMKYQRALRKRKSLGLK